MWPLTDAELGDDMFVRKISVEPAKEDGDRAAAAAVATHRATNDKGVCVVGGAHAFMLRLSSVFGLAPLRFEAHDSGYTVSVSSAKCIYSYILVTILVISTVFGLAAEMSVGMDVSVRMTSRMSQVVSACDVLVVVATAGAGVYGAPRRMAGMLGLLDSVAEVDISLGAQYSLQSERRVCVVLLTVLVAFSVLLVDDFIFYAQQASRFNRTWDVATNYIGFYFLWYIVVMLELQFAFTALSVRARFRAVNDALAHTAKQVSVPLKRVRIRPMNMFAVRVTPVAARGDVSLLVDSLAGNQQIIVMKSTLSGEPRLAVSPCEAVRHLASLHGALCEVVRHIDDSYGLPVVVILISTLLHLIVTPYFLILELMVSSNRVHFLVLQFLWCAMHILRMFVIVEPCHYTSNEGKRTEGLICRLMTHGPSTGVLPTRLELFSRQLMLRSVHYSPLGMCTLDRPLVASLIGAVTTYLVILIQFQRYDS